MGEDFRGYTFAQFIRQQSQEPDVPVRVGLYGVFIEHHLHV